jgi:hypothetical protein
MVIDMNTCGPGQSAQQLSSTDPFTKVLTEMRWSTVVTQPCLIWPGEEHLPKEMVAQLYEMLVIYNTE